MNWNAANVTTYFALIITVFIKFLELHVFLEKFLQRRVPNKIISRANLARVPGFADTVVENEGCSDQLHAKPFAQD